MNHSFKRNIAFTFLTLGGILSLSSCKDSDMEVFVAQDTRNQKLIEAIKAEYHAYDRYVTEMKNAYNSAVEKFHHNSVSFYENIKEAGGRYAWGALDDWPQVSNSDKNSPQNIAGNTKYDVVTKYMGEDWHIPTKAEWQELIDKCQWEDHDTYWLITGPSGKRIILPHFSLNYNTSDRAGTITDNGEYYDVYEFDPEKKTIIQCEAAKRCILITF